MAEITDPELETRSFSVSRPSTPLCLTAAVLMKSETGDTWLQKIQLPESEVAKPSQQSTDPGEKFWPVDRHALVAFKEVDTHHSSCLETKRDATTGLGHKDESTHEKLDDLCEDSWQSLINLLAEDYWQVGEGYIEVVRDGDKIVGLHHLRAEDTHVHVDDVKTYAYHYIIRGSTSDSGGAERRFARFGRRDEMPKISTGEEGDNISEVISIPRPSTRSRWYGMPDWSACVPAVELVMSILQFNYDFFNNRGVPEFIFLVTGTKVKEDDWKKIEALFRQHIGLGNTHKSMALNLPEKEIEVEVIKLANENEDMQGSFAKMLDSLSLRIVSAHRVPPLLAGIQIPGKLGASNELPNAMAAFQALVIGQAQRTFRDALFCTLGKELNMTREAFEFNAITDFLNMNAMQDAAQTRDPLGPADPEGGEGLDESGGTRTDANGVKTRPQDRQTVATLQLTKGMTPEEKGRLIGGAVAAALHLNGTK